MRADRIQPPWRFDDPRVIRRGCPACGSTSVARVLMGMIAWSVVERDVNTGKIALGGCDILYDHETGHPTSPERMCNRCGTEWGRWVGPQCRWPRVDFLAARASATL